VAHEQQWRLSVTPTTPRANAWTTPFSEGVHIVIEGVRGSRSEREREVEDGVGLGDWHVVMGEVGGVERGSPDHADEHAGRTRDHHCTPSPAVMPAIIRRLSP
jgi:hypothetical protein